MNKSTIKALIIDMDGVLWKGDQPIGNLHDTFQLINSRKWKFTLVTNNATRSVNEYARKLNGFGVNINPQQIINSSIAAANYLRSRFPSGGHVFVIGESGLVDTLADFGFFHRDHEVLSVVASMDRQLTYDKLRRATLLVRAGAVFVATNPDRTFPTPEGLVPGAGAILAALEAAIGIHPVVVGKPSPEMYKIALKNMNVVPQETLVIGDRLETDIAAGQAIGCPTALLLSGVTSLAQTEDWTPSPDIVAKDLPNLLDKLI